MPLNERKVRLIDVPGIGDTRGPEQDQQSFDEILSYLNQFEYLNGIWILLRSNVTRLTVFFRYCLKELFIRLYRTPKGNLLFVFTNTRETFFRFGSTMPLLRSLLNEIKQEIRVDISLSISNVFFIENDTF